MDRNTRWMKILKMKWMFSPLQVEKDLGLASQDLVQVVFLGGEYLYVAHSFQLFVVASKKG
jgi:hypothetical protein